jgi:hypothetical protein
MRVRVCRSNNTVKNNYIILSPLDMRIIISTPVLEIDNKYKFRGMSRNLYSIKLKSLVHNNNTVSS